MNKFPALSPRIWHGMRLGDFLRLLGKNRFLVHPLRWPMTAILLPVTGINSVLSGIQEWRYGQAIRETQIVQPPLFVIGHWRTGTTHLHRLLACDDRFAFPTLVECVTANHFVLTASLLTGLIKNLLPKRRQMDNMGWGAAFPSEDELALVAMGGPSTYFRLAFPNRAAPHLNWLGMDDVDEAEVRRFTSNHTRFLKTLTYRKQKRLLLKSPTHTGRVELLAKMFPGARFVHITRNPFDIFPSMRRTWASFDSSQGFQRPHGRNLDEFIFEALTKMYRGFERQRQQIDPGHLCDVRYDELVRDPVGQIEMIYEKLDLADFEVARPALDTYLAAHRDYRPSEHTLDPQIKAQIERRWSGYLKTYGYTPAATLNKRD